MPLPPQVLPGRSFQQVDRKSRLLFHWRAADLSLTPITGQTPTLVHANAGGLVIGSDGRLHGAGHTEPVFEHYDLDGDGIYETPGLLCNRAQQQDATFNDDFGNGAWTKGNITVSTDAFLRGPVLGASVDRLLETTANSTHTLTRTMTITAGDVCLWAVLLRGTGRTKARLYIDSDSAANRLRAVLDVAAGTLTPEANIGTGVIRASGIRKLADGFYLGWVLGTVDPAATSAGVRVAFLDGSGAESYAGDATLGFEVALAHFARGIGEFERLLLSGAAAVSDAASLVSYANAIPTALPDAITVYMELARPSAFDFTGTFANPRYLFTLGSTGWRIYARLLEGANRTIRAVIWDGTTGTGPVFDRAVLAGATQRICVQATDLRTVPKVNLDVGGGFGTAVAGTGIPPLSALGNGTILLAQGPSGAGDALGGAALVLKVQHGAYTSAQMRELF